MTEFDSVDFSGFDLLAFVEETLAVVGPELGRLAEQAEALRTARRMLLEVGTAGDGRMVTFPLLIDEARARGGEAEVARVLAVLDRCSLAMSAEAIEAIEALGAVDL